jgi:SAM-dependent methyltransferase
VKTGLNLGCGTRIFLSTGELLWHNFDIKPGPSIDTVGDWRNLRNYWQSDIDIIVAHQTFEHQGCGEQPIKQCFDVLRPGGSLIVSVPDMHKLALMWLSGELTTQVYMTNVYGPFDGTEESRHRWGFNLDSLTIALHTAAEWQSVIPFDYRIIPGADIARDDRWILCLEAIK